MSDHNKIEKTASDLHFQHDDLFPSSSNNNERSHWISRDTASEFKLIDFLKINDESQKRPLEEHLSPKSQHSSKTKRLRHTSDMKDWVYHEANEDSSQNHLLSLSLSLGMNTQHENPPSKICLVGSDLNFAFKDYHPGKGLNSGKRILESKNDPLQDSAVDINLKQNDLKKTSESSPPIAELDKSADSYRMWPNNFICALNSIKAKLKKLKKSNSSKNPLLVFMQHMDSFADNILMTGNSINNCFNNLLWGESQVQVDQPHRYGIEDKLEIIVDHKSVPLDKAMFDEWSKQIGHHSKSARRVELTVREVRLRESMKVF
ncbi:hypothetical protein PPACK8108_LOCUS7690 [Phakopsora pachyrhizi]|uniref:Uncharacterized protein n=1 Tax=Phakopsora pachyrhizi TaxID=170000 RepID=A0AAV0AVF1_PHAPC|nr:hypothetical protein PPACK8108_LOCUS7690 [Phakopsora pachyrhizi]